MTWIVATVGVLGYGAPVLCLNIRDGWPTDIGRVVFTAWGLCMCAASLWLLWITIKAKRCGQ